MNPSMLDPTPLYPKETRHMKPGSSARCPSKFEHRRCNLRKGHDKNHQAKVRNGTTFWTVGTNEPRADV